MKWWQAITSIFTKGSDPVKTVLDGIDKLSTSGEERMALKGQFIEKVIDAQAKVLEAEAKASSWLTQSWRPIVMLCFAGILVYSFFIGPMFDLKTVPLPDDLWTLLQVGIGGYVGGRTVEKLAEILPKKRKDK
jgi:hypothetical protein